MTTIASANTGNSGTIWIDDDGYYIRLYIQNRGSQTYANGKSWSVSFSGIGNDGGTFSIGKATSGPVTIQVGGAYVPGYTQTVTFTMGATGTTGLGGPTTISATIYRATVPPAPTPAGFSNVQPSQITYQFNGNGDGGSPILEWQAVVASDVNFTQNVQVVGSGGTTTFTGLTPATTYYFASRGRNAVGWGPYSSTTSQSTLPATAPGLTVTPAISGGSATAVLTPPGGASGVTSYRIERRLFGTTTPVTTINDPSNVIVMPGLTPGASYEYRASAFFGAYQSPWTGWIAVTQPNPNTDAGGYWDGNTTDTPALDYGWTGTPNNSTSTATGRVPTGWRTFAQAAVTSGGTGAVFQASGGFQGSYAARAVFFTDSTAYGFAFGTSGASTAVMADVEEGALYFASVYAYPSKAQRVRPVITWFNAGGAQIGTASGAEAFDLTTAGGRVSMSATAPAGAQWASIHVVNEAGGSGALWRGGDWLQLDAAMISLQALFPYFDGNTPDTATFRYDWLGAPNASASTRTTIPASEADAIADPDCPPIPGAPRPPQIDTDCIDDITTWRRYWAIIPESEVFEWLTVVPTLTITTGGFAARQVRVRFHPNPDGLPPSAASDLVFESEQVITYMPPSSSFVLDGISETVMATVDGATPVLADHLLVGSDGGPATWPTLTCGDSYLISLDVPLDAPSGNIDIAVALTTRMMG